jgi:hypothetical protein
MYETEGEATALMAKAIVRHGHRNIATLLTKAIIQGAGMREAGLVDTIDEVLDALLDQRHVLLEVLRELVEAHDAGGPSAALLTKARRLVEDTDAAIAHEIVPPHVQLNRWIDATGSFPPNFTPAPRPESRT